MQGEERMSVLERLVHPLRKRTYIWLIDMFGLRRVIEQFYGKPVDKHYEDLVRALREERYRENGSEA